MAMGASILQGCVGMKYAKGTLNDNGMLVDPKEFESSKGQRPYIVIRHNDLQYPICVYHINDDQYSALLMRCSHQGAELQASGDMLTCPAHGSEFDKWGKMIQAPASEPLRSFPVSMQNGMLFIDLRSKTT